MTRRTWPSLLLGLGLFVGFIVAVPLLLAPDENDCDPGIGGTGTLAGAHGNGEWSDEQIANGKAVLEAAAKLGVSERGQAIGLMVALGESGLNADASSGGYAGIFQQDAGWGTEAERLDPKTSATSFFTRLLRVDGWPQMEPTLAGHAVQRNADPGVYQSRWADAVALRQALIAPAQPQLVNASASFGTKTWGLELRHSNRDDEISPDQLPGFTDPQFYAPALGGMRFTTPALKPGSGGSDNPRTELKEYLNGKRASWNGKQGTHTMTITQTVTKLPKSGMVVVGQIHDEPDDVTVVRLEGSTLYATYDDDTHFAKLRTGYQLGTPFTVTMTSTADGIHVTSDGVSVTVPHPRSGAGYYFKAGMYPQGVTDTPGGVGEVIIHSLSVQHNGATSTFNGGVGKPVCTCQAAASAPAASEVRLTDKRIEQSSALAMSRKRANVVYTMNDDPGPVFAIDAATGKVVGTTHLPEGLVDDTEALAVDGQGRLWIANTGNNHGNSAGVSLVSIDEPGPGDHQATGVHRYRLHYPTAGTNIEALAIHPSTGAISLISRDKTGQRFSLPATLSETSANALHAEPGTFPPDVSDATYTIDGNRVLVRNGDGVTIYDTRWKKIGTLSVPKDAKGESITADLNGTVLTGSEGSNSPLHRVSLNGPSAGSDDGGGNCAGEDGQMLFTSGTWDGGACIPTPVGAPKKCGEALLRAQQISEQSACKAIANASGNWDNRCGEFVANVYGYRNSGYGTALMHYRALKDAGYIKQGEPPPGALVFFTSSQPEGHVAVYAGGGKAWSNDYVRNGCIDLTPMNQIAAGGKYLGWGYPSFPKGSRL